VVDPIKWRKSAVMSPQYRLVNGTELYDIKADPGQKKDIAQDHPKQVAKMRAFYDDWWAELKPTFAKTTEIHLGHPDHPEVTLTAHDWLDTSPPWNQAMVRAAKGKNVKRFQGHWAVKVLAEGRYRIALRRWPAEAKRAITAPLPPGDPVPGASKAYRNRPGVVLPATEAILRLNGKDLATRPVTDEDTAITFTTTLSEGSHELSPVFRTEKGETGAFYCIVTKLP